MSDAYKSHILSAGHQASQDFDAWVLKLGTAGMTLVLGVSALVSTENFTKLVWAGGFFSGSLAVGLLSLRLSADGLRKLSENAELKTDDLTQFKWVKFLNWCAFAGLSAAFVMLAVFVGSDAIPMAMVDDE